MPDPTNVDVFSNSADFLSTLVAGSVNDELKFPSNLSLLTLTTQMVVKGPDGSRNVFPLTVSTDGTFAYRITTGAEFPIAGLYLVELQIQRGLLWEDSAAIQVTIAPAL